MAECTCQEVQGGAHDGGTNMRFDPDCPVHFPKEQLKGDLWEQLAHLMDPHDVDEEPEPGFPWPDPALVETIDRMEEFFSNFAELWRRGADKEICEMGWNYTIKSVELKNQVKEAWDLIDRMIPFMRGFVFTEAGIQAGVDRLLAEIEEKRKPDE